MTKKWSPEECAEDPVRASNVIDDYRGNLSLAEECLAMDVLEIRRKDSLIDAQHAAQTSLHAENVRLRVENEGLRNQLRVMAALGDRETAKRTLTAPEPCELRLLFNKGIGVQRGNGFSFAFPTEEDANQAFHYICDLGTLQTSQPPKSEGVLRGAGSEPCEQHASDCAVNNAPALPVGPCDCGVKKSIERCICPGDYILEECPAQHPAERTFE